MRRLFFFIIVLSIMANSCRHETKRRTDFEVQGIDVSHYQKQIDWDVVAQQDVDFAFVKASEGQSYKDSIFCHNWEEMKRVGVKRGAYHFYTPSVTPELQAQNYLEEVDITTGDLPPVLDFEQVGNKSKEELRRGVRTWLKLVENRYGIRPIIYTNQKLYNTHIRGYFPNYVVWIARYNTIPPDMPDAQGWTFWQYGNTGKIEGIKGDVDFNVFKGSKSDLERLSYEFPTKIQPNFLTFEPS